MGARGGVAPVERVVFRLYVVGGSPNSTRAVANLRALCQEHLAKRHSIEVVDVLEDPLRPIRDGVVVTPTLVKLSPDPVTRIIGDLGARDEVLRALGIGPGEGGT